MFPENVFRGCNSFGKLFYATV